MNPIPLSDLQDSGANAPIISVADLAEFSPDPVHGATRYRHTLENGAHLDALITNKGTGPLVVSFHGALDRQKNTLPRFERMRTTLEHEVSAMFVADPALWLNDKDWFQLAWYTGWDGFDAHQVIADWAVKTAKAIGADRIMFAGSSGGGFAALQTSALVPNSLALVFNPQTSIHGYLANGDHWGAQRNYRRVVFPELIAPEVGPDSDWTFDLGDRASALRRYSKPTENHVLYADSPNDFHHEQHYLPFMESAKLGGNADRVHTHTYEGPKGHTPPRPEQFHVAMKEALALIATLPPTIPPASH